MPAPWWGAAVAALAYLGLVARHIMGPLRALKMLPALLLAAAVAPSSTYGAAALVASAAGDAFLLDKTRFLLHGLAAFLVGHALFAAAFVGASGEWPSPVVLGALALLAGTVTAGKLGGDDLGVEEARDIHNYRIINGFLVSVFKS